LYLKDFDVETFAAYAKERGWSFSKAVRRLARKGLLTEQETKENDPRWTA